VPADVAAVVDSPRDGTLGIGVFDDCAGKMWWAALLSFQTQKRLNIVESLFWIK
jgi:hypothetical protein